MARFVGTKVEFGAETDEFALNADALKLPLVHADTYLNDLLLKNCEAALADRRADLSSFRTKVENAISSLLPHGRVSVKDVARSLGISERTLARRLSDEGLAFSEILQDLKRDLAIRYLDDRNLHVSKIAWLLGLPRGQRIYARIQALDRKDAERNADINLYRSRAEWGAPFDQALMGGDSRLAVPGFGPLLTGTAHLPTFHYVPIREIQRP